MPAALLTVRSSTKFLNVLRVSMALKGASGKLLTFYRPILRDQNLPAAEFPRDFLRISLPEQPNKYYLIIRGQRIVLEADFTIQTIMEKLQSYKLRVALNFEGFQYQLGDFQLRVGKVVPNHSENLRGIVMEMEYLPISPMEKSRQVMGGFFEVWQEAMSKSSLPGRFMHIEPNFAEYGLLDYYTPQPHSRSVCQCHGSTNRNSSSSSISEKLGYKLFGLSV